MGLVASATFRSTNQSKSRTTSYYYGYSNLQVADIQNGLKLVQSEQILDYNETASGDGFGAVLVHRRTRCPGQTKPLQDADGIPQHAQLEFQASGTS